MSSSLLQSDCHSQHLLLAVISSQILTDVQNVVSMGHLCRSCNTAAPFTALLALIRSSNFATIKCYGISVHYIKRNVSNIYVFFHITLIIQILFIH